MSNRVRNIVAGLASGAIPPIFLVLVWLSQDWARSQPQPSATLIHRHVGVGVVGWFSDFQATAFALILLILPLGLLAWLIVPQARVRGPPSRAMPLGWKLIRDDPRRIFIKAAWAGAALTLLLTCTAAPPLIHALNAAGVVWHLG